MACSNCYTGCTQITSDKCVKYTGLANTVLGIQNGDSLNYATSAIMGFLTTALDGTGIKYELAAEDMCVISSQYLTNCTDITVVEITRALSKAICDLDTTVTAQRVDIDANSAFITTLEGNYTIPTCMVGDVGGADGTHIVLQAALNKICAVNNDLTTNYALITDIPTYIADYIADNTGGGEVGYAANMVPYTVVEYYGSLTFFDATGAGTGEWVNIYLCNGNNGTPDKRGRVAVGTTSGMGGGTFDATVNPAISGNPTYTLRSTGGANTVTLTSAQIPSHTHTGTTSIDPGHTHTGTAAGPYVGSTIAGGGGFDGGDNIFRERAITLVSGGSHSHTFTTGATGSGESHSNVQPVLACHYIMYIPTP